MGHYMKDWDDQETMMAEVLGLAIAQVWSSLSDDTQEAITDLVGDLNDIGASLNCIAQVSRVKPNPLSKQPLQK